MTDQFYDFRFKWTTTAAIGISKVKLATIVEGNPKAPFSIATTPRCRGGRYSFPGLPYFTLDPYLIMLSVKQGGIKYHFLSLWYDSTWDWTQFSQAIGEHSNHEAIGIHPTKAWLSQLVNFKNAIWTCRHFRRTIFNKILFLTWKKKATETYGMLQTAFRPSYMNRSSVFVWHKGFKEGRESLRDDDRYGRSKEVNRPELTGQEIASRKHHFYSNTNDDLSHRFESQFLV